MLQLNPLFFSTHYFCQNLGLHRDIAKIFTRIENLNIITYLKHLKIHFVFLNPGIVYIFLLC